MQKTDIVSKLQTIHHNLGHDEDLVLDTSLKDQGYDSLDLVEFVMATEKEFGVSIDDNIMEQVKTPNDVVELIVSATGE